VLNVDRVLATVKQGVTEFSLWI